MITSILIYIGGLLSSAGAVLLTRSPTVHVAPTLSSIHQGAPLRILPLGDSITYGYNEPSGNSYRRDLECLLYTGGNPVELIGSIQNGNWPNNRSDGFSLHTIDQILEAGTPELTRSPGHQPNIVLLHAGTVNLVLGVNVTTAPERLGHLIEFITDRNPDTLLVVAKLTMNANATVQALIDGFNREVPGVVADKARQGRKVVVADMTDLTRADLLSDGTHLNPRGGRKMADHWYQAIVEADRRGLVVSAQGPFTDLGALSL